MRWERPVPRSLGYPLKAFQFCRCQDLDCIRDQYRRANVQISFTAVRNLDDLFAAGKLSAVSIGWLH